MRGTVHHIDFTVSDPEAARPTYGALMAHLGFVEMRRDADGYTEWMHPQGATAVGMAPSRGADARRPADRFAPGLHHVAFAADSRADVDALHARLVTAGVTILDPPAEYPKYNDGLGYYAVFFADPDGIKLEFVFAPWPQSKTV